MLPRNPLSQTNYLTMIETFVGQKIPNNKNLKILPQPTSTPAYRVSYENVLLVYYNYADIILSVSIIHKYIAGANKGKTNSELFLICILCIGIWHEPSYV